MPQTIWATCVTTLAVEQLTVPMYIWMLHVKIGLLSASVWGLDCKMCPLGYFFPDALSVFLFNNTNSVIK